MKSFTYILIIVVLNIIARLLFNKVFPFWKSVIFSFLIISIFEYIGYYILIYKNVKIKILKLISFGLIEFIVVSLTSLILSHYLVYKLMGTMYFSHEKVLLIRTISHGLGAFLGIYGISLLHLKCGKLKNKRDKYENI